MTTTTTASTPVTSPARVAAGVTRDLADIRARRASAEPHYIELHDIRWETYESLVEDVGEQHVFITYDQGRMVIMPPLQVHDLRKKLIARMVEQASIEWRMPIASYGSSTWRRKDLAKGIEADECYYVQHEHLVRGKTEFDLTRDPPPDLAIEVEHTHHPLNRDSIYSALGVNEIWRHDGTRLHFLKRGDSARYHPVASSEAFPLLRPEIIERHLAMVPTVGEFETIQAFRRWVLSVGIQGGEQPAP